jgi:hypothetical protein
MWTSFWRFVYWSFELKHTDFFYFFFVIKGAFLQQVFEIIYLNDPKLLADPLLKF